MLDRDRQRIAAVNRRDPLVAEKHRPYAIVIGRPERDLFARKSLPHEVVRSLERNLPVRAHATDHVRGVVLDRREHLGVAAHTGSITRGRDFQAERFMWPFVVVDLSPPIERLLYLGKA